MSESAEIEINYKGVLLKLPVSLVPYGYTFRIIVSYLDNDITFEPDEERSFRAIQVNENGNEIRPEPELLAAIAAELENSLR